MVAVRGLSLVSVDEGLLHGLDVRRLSGDGVGTRRVPCCSAIVVRRLASVQAASNVPSGAAIVGRPTTAVRSGREEASAPWWTTPSAAAVHRLIRLADVCNKLSRRQMTPAT
jgi:hypothetical protein